MATNGTAWLYDDDILHPRDLPVPLMNDTNYGYDNFTFSGSSAAVIRALALNSWGWWVLQIGTPIVLLVGLPGNVLAFMTLKFRRYRSKSYSHYLCTLAVFDSLSLICKYFHRLNSLLVVTVGYGIYEYYGDAACKLHSFCEHVCYLMSSWLVLCVTLERFVAVNYPFKKDVLCKPRNAIIVILTVFAIMSYSQVFRLVFVQKWTENGQGLCGTSVNQTQVYVAMHIYLYQFVLQFMLPATAIFFCNIVILYRIYHLRYGTNQLLRRDVGTGTLQQQAAEPSRRHLLQAPHHPAAPTQSPHHSAPAAAGVGQASKHQNQQQQPSSSIPLQRQYKSEGTKAAQQQQQQCRATGTKQQQQQCLQQPSHQQPQQSSSLHRSRGRGSSTTQQQPVMSLVRHKTTCMLLIVSFTYIITFLPLVIISIVVHVTITLDPESAPSVYMRLKEPSKVFELFSEINYAANFYIYVLSGTQFRYTMLRLKSCSHSLFATSPPPTERIFHFRQNSSS